MEDVAAYLNETALFRNQWGFRPDKAAQETDPEFKARVTAVLREQLARARDRILRLWRCCLHGQHTLYG